jgi:probable rRNA maturation factor
MNKATDNIQFHYLIRNFEFNNRTACKSFLSQLFRKEKRRLSSLTYIFCSDDYLLDINRRHLQHDYYTDIISFELSGAGKPVVGEIYISIDRVRDNALQLNEAFKRELHRVIFHGALHLCGFRDKTDKESQLMRKMEDKYLDMYFG